MENPTLRQGKAHYTSKQHRAIIAAITGSGSFIVNQDELLEPELAANNVLKIRSGILIHHGDVSIVPTGTYDQVTYSNGTQGMLRIDLVVRRYTKNSETNIESAEWVVIQGTPAESDPEVPAYTKGNMQNGDLVDDCPMFELHFDGLNVTEVKKLQSVAHNLEYLESIQKLILDTAHPIGQILQTTDSRNPGTYLGGTWVEWGKGRVPVGVNSADANFASVEKTGGASSVRHAHATAGHALTVNEMPLHQHDTADYVGFADNSGSFNGYTYNFTNYATGQSLKKIKTSNTGKGAAHSHGNTGSESVSVLQPYITCYMWKRTA